MHYTWHCMHDQHSNTLDHVTEGYMFDHVTEGCTHACSAYQNFTSCRTSYTYLAEDNILLLRQNFM